MNNKLSPQDSKRLRELISQSRKKLLSLCKDWNVSYFNYRNWSLGEHGSRHSSGLFLKMSKIEFGFEPKDGEE